MEETNEIIKELEKSAKISMNDAYNELMDILEPINSTKVSFKESFDFVKKGEFKKVWKQIKKLVEAYHYLNK